MNEWNTLDQSADLWIDSQLSPISFDRNRIPNGNSLHLFDNFRFIFEIDAIVNDNVYYSISSNGDQLVVLLDLDYT